MKNQKRIPIVLEKINWELFITDNIPKLPKETVNLLFNIIKRNLVSIKEIWLNNYDLRLGQLLIKENYLSDTLVLWNVDEVEWLIKNKLCNIEDICFWGRTRDSNNNKLPEIQYILLKDLETAHIAAIIDYCEDNNYKINENYKEYFKKRLKK